MTKARKLIRVGVVGVGRGQGFAYGAAAKVGMQLVAICDTWEEKLREVEKKFNIAAYTEYDKFLEHDIDAVILANYFHEHATFAIKALRADKHVMSETSACLTLAQGVSLIREVQKSGKIYMLAENYPYMVFNQEMRRVFKTGRLGEFMYGEGEYVHPDCADFWNSISCGQNHWRNWIPATYYCTHSLGPIMYITDTYPVKVNGFVIPHSKDDPVAQRMLCKNDAASMISLRMNNGAVVKLLQYGLRGHSIWSRIHGSKGQMENLRQGNTAMVRLIREQYHENYTEPVEQIYLPKFPEHHKEAINAGHGGGDFFMNYYFAQAIRKNQQPFFDVYRGITMAAVGVLAYKSALNDSNTFEIPDFHKEAMLRKYAKDNWSPDPADKGKRQPLPSILGDIKHSKFAVTYARKNWKEKGYTGL